MNPSLLAIFNFVVGTGVVQGMVMGAVLYFLPVKHNGKLYFSLILFILALLSFKILLHTLNLWNVPWFRFLPLAIDTTLPPLLYLYIASITANKVASRKVWLFFIPTIVFMLYAFLIYGWTLTIKDIEHKEQLANRLLFNPIKNAEDYVAVISAIFYWVFGYRLIVRYRKWLFDTQSDTRLQELTWLKNILIISAIIVFGLMVIVSTEDIFTSGQHSFYPLAIFYVYLTVITYYLSLKGYGLYGFSNRGEDHIIDKAFQPDTSSIRDKPLQPANERDYSIVCELILKSLEQDKIYLNPELDVKQLARHIGYPVAAVSAAINQHFGLNFRNLINQYRVKEFKERSVNPSPNLSLFGIALDCGFNSEASFYRIFRQETGLSPNDYIKKHRL